MSTAADPRRAAREACAAALGAAGLERAGAALVLASGEHAEAAPELLEAAAAALGTGRLAGASVRGLLAPGREPIVEPAVGVAVLDGVPVHPFLLADLSGAEARAGEEIARALAAEGGPPGRGDLVLVLPDADALACEPLADGLARALAPAAVAGLGAAEGPGGAPLQWCGRTVATGAVAGLVVRGARPPRLAATGACRPVTELLRVTRARGHWILGLDGRPALDVFREVARGRLARDLRRAAEHILVALPRGPGRPERGELVVRHATGFDPRRRAFAVPFRVGTGDELALAVRDPEWARGELKATLEDLAAGPAPALSLWLSCAARAAGEDTLFGVAGLEAGYVESALGRAPLLGALGPVQIGPVAGRPGALTHSAVGVVLEAA